MRRDGRRRLGRRRRFLLGIVRWGGCDLPSGGACPTLLFLGWFCGGAIGSLEYFVNGRLEGVHCARLDLRLFNRALHVNLEQLSLRAGDEITDHRNLRPVWIVGREAE